MVVFFLQIVDKQILRGTRTQYMYMIYAPILIEVLTWVLDDVHIK